MYFAAGISTAIILVILAGIKPLEEAYRARVQSCVLHIRAERGAMTADQLKKVLGVRGAQMQRLHVSPADEDLEDTTIHLIRVSGAEIHVGAERLLEQPGVVNVRVSQKHRDKAAKSPG